MKKMVYVMMVFLLIGSLFISCSNETAATGDKLNAVRISVGSSRAVDYTVESDVPAVANLYWYYSAVKADAGLYNTGETQWSSVQLVEGTQINLFSQGDWTFCFYGYKEETEDKPENPMLAAVYYSVNLSVTVNNADVYVDIPLTNGPGIEEGKVLLKNLKLNLALLPALNISDKADGSIVLKVYRDGSETAFAISDSIVFSSEATSYDFEFNGASELCDADATAGQHEYTFDVVFIYPYGEGTKEAVVASDSLSVTLDRGLKITFIGAVTTTDPLNYVIVGEITGQTKATAAIKAEAAAAGVTVTSNISPAGVDNPDAMATTAVQFSAGSIPVEEDADFNLSTDVRGISATAAAAAESTDETFVVAEDNVPVASIDLTLTQDDEVVTLNPNGLVTVTTYVAKNLSNAAVYYNGTAFTPAGTIPAANTFTYDAATGKLVFYTNHFSTFVVGSTSVAVNVNTNMAYDTVDASVASVTVDDGQTEILLLSDAEAATLAINGGKTVIFNLGGNELTSSFTYVLNGSLTVKNGTINAIYVYPLTEEESTEKGMVSYLKIESDAIVKDSFAVLLNNRNTPEAYGTTIDVYGKVDGHLWVMGNIEQGDSTINVYGKVTDEIYLNGFATVNVFEGAEIEGDECAIEVRAGNLNIEGGKFVSNATEFTCEPNGSGSTTTGAALAIAQHTTALPIRVNITGGEFTGLVGLFEFNIQKNDRPMDLKINLYDGMFEGTSGIAIYVQDGADNQVSVSNSVRDAAIGEIELIKSYLFGDQFILPTMEEEEGVW